MAHLRRIIVRVPPQIDPTHGVEIRRFEPGASACGYDRLLEDAGYVVVPNGRLFLIREPGETGRGRCVNRAHVIAEIDKVRRAKGLQPIRKGQ